METSRGTVYRFGSFEVDTSTGELLKQGSPVSIQEQPFRLLIVLLESCGEVVTRSEIQTRIWEGDTFVDFDSSLRVAIGKLRTALGDDAANPRYIETIPKRGYRFLGPAIQSITQPDHAVQSIPMVESSLAEEPSQSQPIQTMGHWLDVSFVVRSRRSLDLVRLSQQEAPYRKGHGCACGLHKYDERSCIQRDTSARLDDRAGAVAVPQYRFRRAHPTSLRLMGRPEDARLTQEVAREVCERTGSAAVLDGSIASIGNQYVLGLRGRSCATGDILGEEQAQAARKEDVLNVLSGISSRFRVHLGESLATVQQHNAPLAEATTPSLEALRAYSAGLKIAVTSGGTAAVPFLKRALEIDPKFAMAYSLLGRVYGDLGESELSAESSAKAYELRDRASDEERYWIAASYEKQVTGNLEKAAQICDSWIQAYPRALAPHGFLSGNVSLVRGDYVKAIQEAKVALAMDPDFAVGYSNLAVSDLALGRPDEAMKMLQQAAEHRVEMPDFIIQRYMIAFLKRDKADMDREVAEAQGKPAAEEWMANSQGYVLAYSGRLQEAGKMSGRAEELALGANQNETVALYKTEAASREATFGNVAVARQEALSALRLSRSRDVEYGAAFALALSGESRQSQSVLDELSVRFPQDTKVRFAYGPTLRALLALNHNNPSKAIELLDAAIPYEDGVRSTGSELLIGAGTLHPVYVRGLAYLVKHQGSEAAREFQKILDRPGIVLSEPIGAVARLQLARAYDLAGDRERARTAYRDFLALSRSENTDVPLLRGARAEYLKLH